MAFKGRVDDDISGIAGNFSTSSVFITGSVFTSPITNF